MLPKFSFVTNATLLDGNRLRHFLPAAIKALGDYLDEIIVILDYQKETGRIKKLHGEINTDILKPNELLKVLDDPRIRFVNLDYKQVNYISRKWFNKEKVIRCQAGTPIFAFLFGIEQAKHTFVLRSDCDIFFLELGFMDDAFEKLGSHDLVQTPFLNDDEISFSTRSFFINKESLEKKLPIQLFRLDPLRFLHRLVLGRPTYLALEDILQMNISTKKITCIRNEATKGHTMHIPQRSDFDNIEGVMEKFMSGKIPPIQLKEQHNFKREYWNLP